MLSRNLLKGLLVSFMLLCATHTWAYDFEVDNFQYTIISLDDMTVEVSGLTDTNVTEVIIPETVEYKSRTLDVISIGERAFQGNETLQSISMLSIVTIGSSAFYRCTALTNVVIPNSVTSIGSGAFQSCSSLTEVTIPNSVTSIGNYAFQKCTSLKEITIPNSVTSIGNYAFGYCSSLTEVTIGSSVTSIGSDAFGYCSSLTEVTIPNSVTSVGMWAFENCSDLTKVSINSLVISEYMFTNCSSLENVTIGNSVESIGSYAFQYCSSLTEITVGESVTSIGNYAFYECSSLKELNIPDSVTEIGASAFLGCSGIESFSIGAGIEHLIDYLLPQGSSTATCYPLLWQEGPSQVKSIALKDGPSSLSVAGYGRFSNNSATTGYPVFSNMYVENYYVGRPLTDIKKWTCSTTSKSYSFSITVSQPCGNIGTLEIGGYCNEVPYFYQRVENLILDKNVKTYDVGNIYQGELKNIVCESATPPTLSGTFDNSTYVNVVLSVPEGYKEVYQSAEGWRNFWTIQEVVISGIDSVVNSGEVTEIGRYTVSGQKITTPQKGINIVRYSDGTTRKILVQ